MRVARRGEEARLAAGGARRPRWRGGRPVDGDVVPPPRLRGVEERERTERIARVDVRGTREVGAGEHGTRRVEQRTRGAPPALLQIAVLEPRERVEAEIRAG